MQILLIHGLFGSLSHQSITDAFGSAIVHSPDLLGYGHKTGSVTDKLSLADQSESLRIFLQETTSEPVHVVGHSVGGAVGLLLASDHPELIQSYTSVEGNMTLQDAFWSAEISTKPIEHIKSIITGYKADVGAWIEGAGVVADKRTISIAREWLDNQPATTIRAQAKAVVEATADETYLSRFDVLIRNKIPIHLLAGSESAGGWDLPDHVKQLASSYIEIENQGHLMMLDDPTEFAQHVVDALFT